MNLALDIVDMIKIIPALILLEGFFSGSELALLSADRIKLKMAAKDGSPGAGLALRLLDQVHRIFSTTILVAVASVVAVSGLITIYINERGYAHGTLLAILVTSPLIVIFGELIPKVIFQRHANRLAPWVSYPVYGLYLLLYPITFLLSAVTSRLEKLVVPMQELIIGRQQTTRDELRSLLSMGKKETAIKTTEKRMIKRIFDFTNSEAQQALIPLVKVDALESSSTVQEALLEFQRHRHSRVPVYTERVDNIIGLLEVSDLFSAADLSTRIDTLVTPAHYISETQSLEDAFVEMQNAKWEMAIVVDEYGGAVGILTIEDIVEEIVGEISDEYDTESSLFRALSETSWIIPARTEVKKINEALPLSLPEGDYETLAGFLLQQFGRIPNINDELFFTTRAGQVKFIVMEASRRSIDKVTVELTPSSE
ncbi:MAG: hemolysin family protein [Bacteriovoracia bacterium]